MKGQRPGNWWVDNLLRPIMIAGMMACLATPAVVVLEWMVIGWDGSYFPVFAFFASLEGILSERALERRRITGWGYLASRGAEVFILLLLLKLLNHIPLGLERLWVDASIWLSDPKRFISNMDLFLGLVFVPLWAGSLYVARMARDLDVEEGEASPPPDKTSVEYYLWLTQPPVVRDRQEALQWLGEAFSWGGIAMLLASAGVHFFVSSAKALALPTLLFFALGVAILSQARFSVTHASWRIQGIPIQHGIARRWLLWAVVFLVGVALIALLLPTHYAMGPVRAILAVFGMLAEAVMLILTMISFLVVLLFSFLLPSVERPRPPALTLDPGLIGEPSATAASSPWLEALLSAFFWTAIVVIVGYAVLRFLKDRFGSPFEEEAAGGTWWVRILVWLRAGWRRWLTWRHAVQVRLARRRAEHQEREPVTSRFFRFLSLRGLPARELVRYFYLSTAKRAAQAGQPRQPSQTPHEYQASLDHHFPDLEPDLTGLTDAFIEARYSRHPVQPKDAEAVKPLWQRIKAALRRRRARL